MGGNEIALRLAVENAFITTFRFLLLIFLNTWMSLNQII